MRLGLVSGPKPVLDRISLHMQASVMHASGLSQVRLEHLINGGVLRKQPTWTQKFPSTKLVLATPRAYILNQILYKCCRFSSFDMKMRS